MSAVDQVACPRCGGATDGWKCAICGSESTVHNPNHLHAGSDRYCTLMCEACEQADVLCTCA